MRNCSLGQFASGVRQPKIVICQHEKLQIIFIYLYLLLEGNYVCFCEILLPMFARFYGVENIDTTTTKKINALGFFPAC